MSEHQGILGNAYDASGLGDIFSGLGSYLNIFSGYGPGSSDVGAGYNLRYPSDLGSGGAGSDLDGDFIFNSSSAFKEFNTGYGEGNPHITFELFQPIMANEWSTLETKWSDADLQDRDSGGNATTTYAKKDIHKVNPIKTAKSGPPILTYKSMNKISLYMTPNINISDSMHYETGSRSAAAWMQHDYKPGQKQIDIDMGLNTLGAEAATAAAGAAAGFLKGPGAKAVAFVAGGIAAGAKVSGDEDLRRSGLVYNPNEYLQFKNSQLRSFEFQFKFLPNSAQESASATAIIKAFRAGMRPKKITALTMEAPYQVQTTFVNAGSMPQISTCYVTQCNVVYNPNSASFFKHSGEPVEIDFSIQMQEIFPIYRNDIEGNIEKGGRYGDASAGYENQKGIR